ncbi:MAG: cytochrome b/b6 domain-containing protein [Variovorax sp.]
MKVWDLSVRVLHWSLAAAVGMAWLTGEALLSLHEAAGYVGLAVVTMRIAWGWVGGRTACFARFVRPPGVVWRYAKDAARRAEARHVGHNPLGAWMVVLLMLSVGAVGLTGWLYTLDMFWGFAWLEALHRNFAWLLLALIGLHVAGVAYASWCHRENLVAAMLTGRKRPAAPGDID